jgi:hypothetical protein
MLADVMVTVSQPSTTKLAAIKCSAAILKAAPALPPTPLRSLYFALCTMGTHANTVLRTEAMVTLAVIKSTQDLGDWPLAGRLLDSVLAAQADLATDNDAFAKVVGQFVHSSDADISIGVLTAELLAWTQGDHQADKQRAILAVLAHVHDSQAAVVATSYVHVDSLHHENLSLD